MIREHFCSIGVSANKVVSYLSTSRTLAPAVKSFRLWYQILADALRYQLSTRNEYPNEIVHQHPYVGVTGFVVKFSSFPTSDTSRRLLATIFILVLSLILSPISAGQVNRETIVEEIGGIVDALPRQRSSDSRAWLQLSTESCAPPSHHERRAAALREEAEAKDSDPELELNASATEGLSGSQADERNARIGVEWRLLGNGVLDNHHWSDQLQRRASVAQLDAKLDYRKRNIRCQTQQIIESLQHERRDLLKRWSRFLDKVLTAVRRDYLSGRMLIDKLLDLEADQRIVEQELRSLPAANSISLDYLPRPFSLDFEAIREAVQNDRLQRRRRVLETAITRNDRELEKRRERRLSARLGYEIDDDENISRGLVAGVRYSMPIFASSYKDSTELRAGAQRQRIYNEKQDRLAVLDRLQAEFEEQERRTIRQQYRYLIARERLRRSAAELNLDRIDENLGRAVLRANDAFDSANERLLALELLYRKAGRVFETASLEPEDRYFERVSLPDSDYRVRAGQRSLYVWSHMLDTLSTAELVEFAKARAIGRLLVSVGPDVSQSNDRLPASLRAAADSGDVTLQRLLGTTQWALPENHDRAIARLNRITMPDGGLHLDVEPHTLTEETGTASSHLEGYLELLRRVHETLDTDIPLHVSVPTTWTVDTYRRISNYVDRIYIMAYPSRPADRVVRELERIKRAVAPSALVIAVRANEFTSEWELDRTIREIRRGTNIERFAIHDAQALFDMTRDVTQ